jgi:acetoin utilization deacetylase AcuC-like enzyme
MMATGFLYDPAFLEHDTGFGHPERRERLSGTMDHLQKQSWFAERLKRITPKPAAITWIQQIHEPNYIERARATCAAGYRHLDSLDVSISQRSFDIALLAAGGALELADRLMAGEIDNGFALLRPPGHHAELGMALGFCLFNNVAILARYLQKQYGLDKILILDWDVHHGNGTQHTFEEDPSVLYVSLHQYPFYPGTGAYSETGIGKGAGATLNCPMSAGATDTDYQAAFTERILPKLNRFKPEAVLISAGFDAHTEDPLAQICLSTECFGWMSARMMEVAETHAGGRLLSLLEGGYNLHALPLCIEKHLTVLANVEDATPLARRDKG